CVQVGHDLVNNLLWDNVVIEDCYFWTDSLLKDMDAWRKGEIPGRGAVEILAEGTDNSSMKAPAIVLSNIKARGWAEGYINNQAGFEIKGKVECLADRIRCYGCDIAFRLSGSTGSPLVTLTNSVVYKCEKVLQVGNGLEDLHIYNCTFGAGNVGLIEESGGGSGAGLEMKNCLVLAGEKPLYMADSSNLAAAEDWFVSVANNDYHLSPGAPAVGAGVFIPGVESDFDGKLRPVRNPSVGAYESAEAAEANYMRLAEVEAAARSRFTVGLYYGSSAIIGEFKFSVSFDRTALELESVTQVGKAYTMTVVQSDIAAANESGTAAFSLADLSGYFPIQPGAGEIVQIVFKDIAGIEQEVVLTLSDLGATTPWGAELDYTPRNGKVTIVAGSSKSCDLNGDGVANIRDVIAFLLLGRDYPADLRLDWNGDGRYSIADAVQLLLDISHGNCPDSPALSAAGKAKSILSPRLSGDDIRYIERILKQMDLTQEQEAEFRLALYGESGPPALPGSFSLSQNYPNPFNPATTIAFDMPSGGSGQVKIEIYDLRGRLVRTLVDGVREPGRHEIFWDGTDSDGRTSASGVYIYRMQAGSFSTTRKMVLLK
ncbi:MAG TPA: FlgD immunoglobulin-like domain containing protein, partial [archaeon]|nr:FlgD immunoglobulin-like domain containing protein [archaeon]